jgi:hypothetical protein
MNTSLHTKRVSYVGSGSAVTREGTVLPLWDGSQFSYQHDDPHLVQVESWIDPIASFHGRVKHWNPFVHYKYEVVKAWRGPARVEMGFYDSPYATGIDGTVKKVSFLTSDLDSWGRKGYRSPSGYMTTPNSWYRVPLLYNGVSPFPSWGRIASRNDETGEIIPVLVFDQPDLERRAMKALLPGIKAELSTINSVIELKDLVTLKGTVKHVKQLLSSAAKIQSVSKLLTEAKRSVQSLADVWLQANFGIKPLIGDLQAIYKVLHETHKKLNVLLASSGKLTKRHYKYSWHAENATTTVLDAGVPFPYPLSGYRWPLTKCTLGRRITSDVYVYHAELELDYSFSVFQEEYALLLAYQDALGININPGVVWNAIPYSFVVDWVANIGDFLDRFSVQLMTPTINIRRFCWSIKRERSVGQSLTVEPDAHGDILSWAFPQKRVQNYPVRGYRESFYKRSVSVAPSGDSLQTSGISLKELSLGLALLVPQGPGKKRRTRSR